MDQKPWCFCNRKSFESRIFRENEYFYCLFDDAPVSPGHALIAPKEHIVSVLDLRAEMWNKLFEEITQSIEIIKKTDMKIVYREMLKDKVSENNKWFLKNALYHPRINTTPDAYNHGVNDGRAAGRTADHLHWHIIPRYDGDMADPRGGVRHVIPELGNYKISR